MNTTEKAKDLLETFEQLGETKTFRLVDTDEWKKQNKAKDQN